MLLTGDIGGTKTVLSLIEPAQGARRPLRQSRFASDDFDSLDAIISNFLSENERDRVRVASFGVAGPVVDNRAEITNLPWVIDAAKLEQDFAIDRVFLLNDLEAIACAVPNLQPDDLVTLKPGTAEPDGAIAVIAPGTGLGEAFLTWNGRTYQAHPSEGGHSSFGPMNAVQRDLLAYLQNRFDHVSYERVCSGSGIPNLYAFLRDTGRFTEPDWLCTAVTQAEDPTPIIFDAALEKEEPMALAVLDLFISILADEAGNLALKVLSTGGIFVGGGIPPRILPLLQRPYFLEQFQRKGRFSDILADMPIYVICHPQAGLLGAAEYALQRMDAKDEG